MGRKRISAEEKLLFGLLAIPFVLAGEAIKAAGNSPNNQEMSKIDSIFGIIGLCFLVVIIMASIAPSLCLFCFKTAYWILLIYLIYEGSIQIYEYFYYTSEKFLSIKNSLKENTDKFNEFNLHVEELKQAYQDNITSIDYGQSDYFDESYYNFKRPLLEQLKTKPSHIHECSLSVCKNAQAQPFKYLFKYFKIKPNEVTLANFEKAFNDFSAADEGKRLLFAERERIIDSIRDKVPFILIKFRKKKFAKKLGLEEIDVKQFYFPKYTFRYISPGGNSSMICDIVLDTNNLSRLIDYLSYTVNFRHTIAGQRALMTSELRHRIKERDKYTCQICGLSIHDEPNLLLEIDHIIPLSKGGITTESNLQTLCWKCNRAKSNKILNKENSAIVNEQVFQNAEIPVVAMKNAKISEKIQQVVEIDYNERLVKLYEEKLLISKEMANYFKNTNTINKSYIELYERCLKNTQEIAECQLKKALELFEQKQSITDHIFEEDEMCLMQDDEVDNITDEIENIVDSIDDDITDLEDNLELMHDDEIISDLKYDKYLEKIDKLNDIKSEIENMIY